jgi:hypothetical protein
MASTLAQAQGQESFGSFLQKRTASFLKLLSSLDFLPDGHFAAQQTMSRVGASA